MLRNTLAEPFAENLQPSENWYRTLRTELTTTPIVIYKALLSKLIYTEEMLSEEEAVALFLAYEEVEKEISRNGEYHKRYFWLYFITRLCFVNLDAFRIDLKSRQKVRKDLEPYFSFGRQQLSARIYYSSKLDFKVRMVVESPKKPKPRNRIGVGYRDKGSARDVSWDGTPSWQETCQDEEFRNDESQSISSKLETLRQKTKTYLAEAWHSAKAKRPTSLLARQMKG